MLAIASCAARGVSLAPLPGTAGETPLAARVVAVERDRAYVLAPDSAAIAPGLLLRFHDRGGVVASGVVERVLDGALGSVRLIAGSLAGVKRPERLAIGARRPPLPSPALLRVGVPLGARENLLLRCAGDTPPAIEVEGYRFEALAADAQRGVRLAAAAAAAPWPDTLLVRFFRDAADEEIAFDRGELDVAVFWPGEPAIRARPPERGGAPLLGLRSRGVLVAAVGPAAAPAPGDALRDSRLVAMNAGLFGGALAPWPGVPRSGDAEPRAPAAPPDSARGNARPAALDRPFAVDPALPGGRTVEHFLNGGASLHLRDKLGPVRLALRDAPLAAADSLEAAWRAQGVTPLFALRCPVLAAAPVRELVRALGPEAFARLAPCAAAEPPR